MLPQARTVSLDDALLRAVGGPAYTPADKVVRKLKVTSGLPASRIRQVRQGAARLFTVHVAPWRPQGSERRVALLLRADARLALQRQRAKGVVAMSGAVRC